jgi:putative nucleotidyltransferase with HDIG domain
MALLGKTGRRRPEPSGPSVERAALEIASGQTPRSLVPLSADDGLLAASSEKRWRARVAAFSGPALYVPVVSPPHVDALVKLVLRDRAVAVGEVVWSRNKLPLAGAAVRFVRLGENAPPAEAVALATDAWERLIASAEAPALPEAAAGVLRSTAGARSGAAEVARSLSQDPALSRSVIDLANTAGFRATEPLRDVRAAVVRLGVERVRSLVLASSVFDIFPAEAKPARGVVAESRVSPDGLWTHSLAAALVAEAFARAAGLPADDAFLAGLFHDVGKFLLVRVLAREYASVLDQVEEWGLAIGDAEKAVLGFSHERAGAWLLSKWGLPGPVVAAVAGHHGSGPGRGSPAAAAAHLGDLFARVLAAGTTWDRHMPQVDPVCWETMHMAPEDASAAVALAADAVASGAAVFEQARVRPPFLPRAAHATEADPILRNASEAIAARRRADLFEGETGRDPYLAGLLRGAEALAAAAVVDDEPPRPRYL